MLVRPARAQLLDQLSALVALETMDTLRAVEFSAEVDQTAAMGLLKEDDGYATLASRGDDTLSIGQNLSVTLHHRYAGGGALRAPLLKIDNDQHDLTDEHGLFGHGLLQSGWCDHRVIEIRASPRMIRANGCLFAAANGSFGAAISVQRMSLQGRSEPVAVGRSGRSNGDIA
jgi:hypothetical protein